MLTGGRVDASPLERGVQRDARWQLLGQSGGTVWLTGFPAAGKSALGHALEALLFQRGVVAHRLDGDDLRLGLCRDLGFDRAGRAENVRRVGEVSVRLAEAGLAAIVSLVSPYAADRTVVRSLHEHAGLRFAEVWLDTPLRCCSERDPRGLYARARRGELPNMTGVDSPYEPPTAPDFVVRPEDGSPETTAALLADWLTAAGWWEAPRATEPTRNSQGRGD